MAYEDKTFEDLLFSEMHYLPIPAPERTRPTKRSLLNALTVSEEMIHFGYKITGDDLVRLALLSTDDIKKVASRFQERMAREITWAHPLFPDFPKQVIEISAASYRIMQMAQYMTWHGIDLINELADKVEWLQNIESTEKTVDDDDLIECTTLTLIGEREAHAIVLGRLASKSKRLNKVEEELLRRCIAEMAHTDVLDVLDMHPIRFKENLMHIAYILEHESADPAAAIASICQHPGDVLKCASYALTHDHYKWDRATKRVWTEALDSYGTGMLAVNLAASATKQERYKMILRYLDYTRMTKIPENKDLAHRLCAGELKGWEALAKKRIADKTPDALDFIASRPGMFLRWLNWLTSIFGENPTFDKLAEIAPELSLATLLDVYDVIVPKHKAYAEHMRAAITERLRKLDTPLSGRSVYVDAQNFDMKLSRIMRSEQGGYVRPGLVMTIPRSVRVARFFVYWNDEHCVDVDLHANGKSGNVPVHIGWNSSYKQSGVVMSGDITHSDAAEFIDIDLEETTLDKIVTTLDLYSGKPSFKDIDTCFCGMMAVSKLDEDVKLYQEKNCFFYHDLDLGTRNVTYAVILPKTRKLALMLEANASRRHVYGESRSDVFENAGKPPVLSISEYVDMLLAAQGATRARSKKSADVVLSMATEEGAISLLDNNMFLDA